MIGQALAHYRIIEKIGAGGMGEVYRARDEHLGRDVALKVLPAGTLADEAARKRFRKEAQALSKLNHPNIATVHDFDTQDGVDFLVMELVEGVTLSDKLAVGPLGEKEITRLGAQLAEGLAAAHERRVVHRDLKPANLRVTPDGRLKILDFGLAKLVRPDVASATAPTESFTETQGVAGTLPYMAPEQLRGSVADHRSDIYSFGAVLYEMATGQRAFAETQAGRLMDAILHTAPVVPTRFQPRLSGELERIILKCLEKDPENRYQSAKEIGLDMRRLSMPDVVVSEPRKRAGWLVPALAAGLMVAVLAVAAYFARDMIWPPPPTGKVMLAVLPFDNLSGDPEQEYFSDGLTEEMIAQLGRLQPQRLGVIARTSAMLYKDSEKPIDQIGRELGVGYILEGSVRREAVRVRITTQLILVSDQTQLWAESYEQELASVFAIQSDVAGRVARALEIELLPAQQAKLASTRPVNPEAYEAYLKGGYFQKPSGESLKKSIEYFQQAISIDPNYAPVYARLALSRTLLARFNFAPDSEQYPKARIAALKALEIDDTLAEAHVALGHVKHWFDWDWTGAEREFRRAIELDPNSPVAHTGYALYLVLMGRMEEAIAETKQIQIRALDPLGVRKDMSIGWILYEAHQYDQAIEGFQRSFELDPGSPLAHAGIGLAYVQKRMYEKAIAELQEAVALGAVGGPSLYPALLAYAYAVSGRKTEARKILNELKQQMKQRHVSPFNIAEIHTGLGEKDRAFEWLEKAYEEHDEDLVFIRDPILDPLRSDPRFQSLLRRMNFPE